MEKWIMFVLTHRANFNPRGIFVVCSDHFTDKCFQRAGPFQLYENKDPEKNSLREQDER